MQLFWRILLVAILALSTIGATAPNAASATTATAHPPNVILITLDTTRADRMGFLGSKLGLTPNLDALARYSVAFTRAYAQVPLTTPSHAALLTGTYPQFNQLENLGEPLREDLPYVPEVLHDHGYHTAAFVGSIVLDPESGAGAGFDRGFDVYDSVFHYPKPGEDRYQSMERRAEDVANRALGWLRDNRDGPFFVWMHFYDPHDPYDPPEPFKTHYAQAPYDGEIAYTDSVVGSVLDVLQKHGLFENCMIVIAADHGEAFGEHGEKHHGLLLYDETIHVPLLVKLPDEKHAGKRIEQRVALVDVAPSILEGVGIQVPAGMQALSLFPLMDRPNPSNDQPSSYEKAKRSERAIYSESDYAHRSFGWSELRSWRAGKYLYVQAPKKELYDQVEDAASTRNLAASAKAVADTLDEQLSDFHQKTGAAQSAHSNLNSANSDGLRALGYLGTDSGVVGNKGEAAVNPRDKVGVINELQSALLDLEEGRFDEATAGLQRVVRDPDAVNAYLEFGIAMAHRQRYQEATILLRQAAAKIPDSVVAHFELAKVLADTGQWEAALPEMQAASRLKPDSAQLHFYIASVFGHLNRVADAATEYEKSLKIDPQYFDTNLTYGRLLLMEGHADGALSKLSEAVKVRPESAEAHGFLADAYERLGRTEDAKRERAQAEKLKPPSPE